MTLLDLPQTAPEVIPEAPKATLVERQGSMEPTRKNGVLTEVLLALGAVAAVGTALWMATTPSEGVPVRGITPTSVVGLTGVGSSLGR